MIQNSNDHYKESKSSCCFNDEEKCQKGRAITAGYNWL